MSMKCNVRENKKTYEVSWMVQACDGRLKSRQCRYCEILWLKIFFEAELHTIEETSQGKPCG